MNEDDLFYGEREPEKKDTGNGQNGYNDYNDNNNGYNNGYDNGYNNGYPQKKSNPLAIASLITGILSLLCIVVPYFGLPLAIAGIVTAVLSRHQGGANYMSGMAVAGLVLSIVGLVMCAFLLIMVVYMMLNPEYLETIYEEYYDIMDSMDMGTLIHFNLIR